MSHWTIDEKREILQNFGLLLTPEFEQVVYPSPREKMIIGGWRASKSTSLAADFALDMMEDTIVQGITGDSSLYWLVGPDYTQTSEEFRYLDAWFTRMGLVTGRSTPLEGPKSLDLVGNVRVETKSAGHPERLGSKAPKKIGVCEAGQTSEETRVMMLGRALQMDSHIIYAGTIEDDEGSPQWAWYQELAAAWLDGKECKDSGVDGHVCATDHIAYSLPSWANKFWFPEGRNDPKIKRLEQIYDDHTFKRRIAAIPTGVQFAVYPQLPLKREVLLGVPEGRPYGGAGGIDFGTVHPSTLVAVQLFPDPNPEPDGLGPQGIACVREVWFNDQDPGDTFRLQANRKILSRKWGIRRWATDPNERYMARSSFAEAVSGSQGAREHRVGLTTARLNLNKLMFDPDGPGVMDLYEEMSKVHRRKSPSGELKLWRMFDDRTAGLEDAIELLDGHELVKVPKPISISAGVSRAKTYGRRNEFSRVG